MYKAVLDTCALVPGLQRDFLLQLAAERAYAPLWGTGILFELDYVLARIDSRRGINPKDSDDARTHLFETMQKAFPGATIDAPKDREYDYQLDDRDDGHVAHAAIMGKADAIVTNDEGAGFRTSRTLSDASIETLNPAEFATNTVAAHPQAGARALQQLSMRRATTTRAVLDELHGRYAMTGAHAVLFPLL